MSIFKEILKNVLTKLKNNIILNEAFFRSG